MFFSIKSNNLKNVWLKMLYTFIIFNYGFGWPCIFCIKIFNSIYWVQHLTVIVSFDFNFVIIIVVITGFF